VSIDSNRLTNSLTLISLSLSLPLISVRATAAEETQIGQFVLIPCHLALQREIFPSVLPRNPSLPLISDQRRPETVREPGRRDTGDQLPQAVDVWAENHRRE